MLNTAVVVRHVISVSLPFHQLLAVMTCSAYYCRQIWWVKEKTHACFVISMWTIPFSRSCLATLVAVERQLLNTVLVHN